MSGTAMGGPDSLPPMDAGAARWLADTQAQVSKLVDCQRDVKGLHTLLDSGDSMEDLGERIRACAGSLDEAVALLDTMQQQAVHVLELLKAAVRQADLQMRLRGRR